MPRLALDYQSVPPRPDWRTILFVLAVALAARVAALILRGDLHSAEAGLVAWSILHGHGFGSPFETVSCVTHTSAIPTSPSTHLPPLYPLLLAGFTWIQNTLHLPGELTRAMLASSRSPYWPPKDVSAHCMALTLNLLASCLLPLLALRLAPLANLPRRVGLLAAIALCFCPEALRAVGLIWDEALFATASAALLYLIAKLLLGPQLPTWRNAALLGTLSGLLSLLNPAMVLAIPAAYMAGLATRRAAFRTLALHAVLLVTFTFVGGSPWHIRNWLLIDPPAYVFIRGNFWLEVWSNANPITWTDAGTPQVMHPWHVNGIDPMVRDGQPLTEAQYFAWCKQRALALPLFHSPAAMGSHLLTQANAFWLGQAEAARWHRNQLLFLAAQGIPALLGLLGFYLARKSLDRALRNALLAVLLVQPLPYYLSGGAARYRHPIDFILYLGLALTAHHLYHHYQSRHTPTAN